VKVIKKSIVRLLKWVSVAMISVSLGALIVLQLPYIQNRLFGMLLQHLSHTTQLSITYQRFQCRGLHQASLVGLVIKDPQDHTMLTADRLSVEMQPLQLLVARCVTLKSVYLQGARVHLPSVGEDGDRGYLLLQRLASIARIGSDTPHAPPFVVEQASLRDVSISVNDPQAVSQQDPFDAKSPTLHEIDAELTHLKVQDGMLTVDIAHLSGKHADSPLWVDHFGASLVASPGRVQCKALQLRTAHSALTGDCTFAYDPALPLAALNDHLHMTAHLARAVVAAEELAAFMPYFEQHQDTYTLCGVLEGKVNDLSMSTFQLDFGEQGSYLKGCLSLQGLLKMQKAAVFNIELKEGHLHTQDLLPYLDERHHKQLAAVKRVKTEGCCQGKLADFVVNATFDTNLGQVHTDLKVQVDPLEQRTTYKGIVATRDFALGIWWQDPALQQLTMHGQIAGEGLTWATAHFQLEADIDTLGLNHYVYENIHVQGHFARAIFEGKLVVDDPHLQFQADVALNLNRDIESIAVKGVLDRASLQALRLTDRSAILRAQLSVDAQGLSWDTIKADVKLAQFCFDLEGEELRLDALHIHTDQGEVGRSLALDSALFSLKVAGDFSYPSLVRDVDRFIQSYQGRLTHAALPSRRTALQPCTLTYQLHCKNMNPLLRVLGVDAYVSPNTRLEGSFLQHEEAVLSLRASDAASLAFKQNRWENTQLALTARQSKDGQAVSAVVQLASKQQQWGRLSTTKSLDLLVSWQNDKIAFSSSLGQPKSTDRLHLKGQAFLSDSVLEVVLTPTPGAETANQWCIHPENRITFDKSQIRFQHVTFYKGTQQISLAGVLSANPAEVLHLKMKDYSLDNLNGFLNQQFTGVLNAVAVLGGTLNQPRIDSTLTFEKLVIDHVSVGDVHAYTRWDDPSQRLNMTCQVGDRKQQTVAIQGIYAPTQEANSLQLTAHLTHAPMAVLAPFMANHFSQLAGALHGTVHVHGSPSSPQLTGGVRITNATVGINYLNTSYGASGALIFDNQAVNITTLYLSDDQQGRAVLQGSLVHKDFSDFQIDVTGSMTNLRVLSTASKDNKYFYGTGIVSGSLTASGPLNNMALQLKVRTEPGTHICIPTRGTTNEAVQYDFVRFVNPKVQDKAMHTKPIPFKGLKLTLLLAITPEAHAELILDAKNAEMIKGRGQGNIKLEVDTEGVHTMTGEYAFLTGSYHFSLYRLVNRTFKILPGSKITWHDRPKHGILDVEAIYEQRASLASLMQDVHVERRVRNKYPVQVLIGLRGPLLSPEKHFSVNFPAYPSELVTVVNAFKRRVAQDSQYAQAQALSLLVFKEFSHEKIMGTEHGTVDKYVKTLAFQALSSFTLNVNDQLDVDLAIDPAVSASDLDALHLNLSYRLADRLWIYSKGSLLGTTAHAPNVAHLIGDWAVEYLLTRDGRIRAKLYMANTTQMNAPDAVRSTGGVSLLYTQGFNHWLLSRRSKRAAQ